MEVIEYKWKRTPYSKTFQVGRDKKKRVVSLTQLHYKNGESFTEIDTRPKETEKGWKVETPHYRFELIKFPFEIRINGNSIRNLDSPNTDFPKICKGEIAFRDIKITLRSEGIDILGKGTWKINGEVREAEAQTYNFAPVLKAGTAEQYLEATGTKIPGEVISQEIVNGNLEVIFSHDQDWLNNDKQD